MKHSPLFLHKENGTYPLPRENRLVGIFYFLWLGEHGRHQPYDISKIVAEHPDAGYHGDEPYWGGVGTYHHWGEPFYGYYYSDDEWVVRRHMKLMVQSGVDFLFFDTTNALIYEKNAKLVLSVLQEYHDAGWRIPKVMFYTNTASGQTAQTIYESIYKANFCPDTWFYYEGKPVIIAIPGECSPEVLDFFNVKLSQWPNEPDKLGGWPWMDFTRPQRAFGNLAGVPECINVSVAQHPQLRFGDSVLYGETTNWGRAYHDGANDPAPDAYKRCCNFIEQFDRALEADVPVTLVTGWNEWIAGRRSGSVDRPFMFVDCANYEYSRDIEMMRGGYFDNYYAVLCDYVARRKGQEAEMVLAPGASLTFPGYPDGNFNRNHPGYGTIYVNETGRHSIRALTVTDAGDSLHFTAETADPIGEDRQGAFLWLFGEAGGKKFCLRPVSDSAAEVCAVTEDEDRALTYVKIGEAAVAIAGHTLTYHVKKSLLGAKSGAVLDMKICDSREAIVSAEDFYDHGDVLPLGRHTYRVILA